jgi:hypothetical protein
MVDGVEGGGVWKGDLGGGGGISICVAGRGVVRVGGGFCKWGKEPMSKKIPTNRVV